MKKQPLRLLTVAGSSAGGSAGIQADLKTFEEHNVFGLSVVTALVARHPETDLNVHKQTLEAIDAQFFTAQRQVGRFDGMKTGMLFSEEIIKLVSKRIEDIKTDHLVVDPVMVGKHRSKLLKDDAIDALITKLIPQAEIITPNMYEASLLLNNRVLETVEDLKRAAKDLHVLGAKHVLVKGGRLDGPAVDVLFDGQDLTTFTAPRIKTVNTSGAGCTYSAAIAANLAKGYKVEEAVHLAKTFITTAITHGFSYTDLPGPTFHQAQRLFGQAHEIKVNAD